jgi:hypothetical protein
MPRGPGSGEAWGSGCGAGGALDGAGGGEPVLGFLPCPCGLGFDGLGLGELELERCRSRWRRSASS